MLESMLIPQCPAVGRLISPLSCLVFHLGDTGPNAKPCEAAFLASSQFKGSQTPTVCVYVSPGSLRRTTRLYGSLGSHVHVKPLYLSEEELDASAILSIMAVGSSESAPLYM